MSFTKDLLSTVDPACDHCKISNSKDCKEDGHFFCKEQVRVILNLLKKNGQHIDNSNTEHKLGLLSIPKNAKGVFLFIPDEEII